MTTKRPEAGTILVLDNDEAFLESMEEYLKADGYEVQATNDRAKALAAIASDFAQKTITIFITGYENTSQPSAVREPNSKVVRTVDTRIESMGIAAEVRQLRPDIYIILLTVEDIMTPNFQHKREAHGRSIDLIVRKVPGSLAAIKIAFKEKEGNPQ